MRIKNLVLNELSFIWKYGIVLLYIVFTVFYIGILAAIPYKYQMPVSIILILSDPSAMGLFFMGAIILLERNQRVDSSLAISPVRKSEYIMSKIIPMMLCGMLVSLVIALFVGSYNILLLMVGVMLSSILFSLCGLIVGTKVKSLNAFMVSTIPFEVILFIPAVLYQMSLIKSPLWLIHPGVSAIYLINGNYNYSLLAIASLLFYITLAFILSKKCVNDSMHTIKGVKI